MWGEQLPCQEYGLCCVLSQWFPEGQAELCITLIPKTPDVVPIGSQSCDHVSGSTGGKSPNAVGCVSHLFKLRCETNI